MDYTRRELCLLLPALVTSNARGSEAKGLPSKVYGFESLPLQASGQNAFRAIFGGKTHEGFRVALHETDLAPGAMPHPPHHHEYEEIFLIREGLLQVTIGERNSTLSPGSVAYVASNEEHGIRNVGNTHAQYFVLELGTEDA
jgi:mannose-6-phosphate isomerase-like protein (cupin superfamily)